MAMAEDMEAKTATGILAAEMVLVALLVMEGMGLVETVTGTDILLVSAKPTA